MDGTAGAVIVRVSSKRPLIGSVITSVGVCRSTEIKKVAKVFVIDSSCGSSRSMSGAIETDIIWGDVDSCRSNQQCRSTNAIMDRSIGTVVVGVSSKTPLVGYVIAGIGVRRSV